MTMSDTLTYQGIPLIRRRVRVEIDLDVLMLGEDVGDARLAYLVSDVAEHRLGYLTDAGVGDVLITTPIAVRVGNDIAMTPRVPDRELVSYVHGIAAETF